MLVVFMRDLSNNAKQWQHPAGVELEGCLTHVFFLIRPAPLLLPYRACLFHLPCPPHRCSLRGPCSLLLPRAIPAAVPATTAPHILCVCRGGRCAAAVQQAAPRHAACGEQGHPQLHAAAAGRAARQGRVSVQVSLTYGCHGTDSGLAASARGTNQCAPNVQLCTFCHAGRGEGKWILKKSDHGGVGDWATYNRAGTVHCTAVFGALWYACWGATVL